MLEQEAASAPADANAEARFFTALVQRYPAAAVERFESRQFPVNAEITAAYLKAAAATGANPSMAGNAMGGGIGAGLGSQASPIYVRNTGADWKEWAQGAAKSLVVFFVAATILSSFLDLSNFSKIMPASNVNMAETSDRRFSDVVGIDEAKNELQEIVLYLKNPGMFTRLGGKLPKGLMLTGPPGTGKTLLARAIAGEAGVPFFYTSGSEFDEMFVGVGAKRVRELFAVAKKQSPCIIFIDEIDALGSRRQVRDTNGAMRMTLNQLLTEMDGFSQNTGVIVIGATNFPDVLDQALTRPGRFDKHVVVPLPDVKGREEILNLYGARTKLAPEANLKALAQGTPGMSGADLYNLVNQAAVKASLDGLKFVTTEALEWARDKIQMGAERRSAVISKETAKLTAYHEGGHAIVAMKTPGAHPVHKATIMPRGQALGYVMQLPEGDQTSMTRKQMLAKMDVCMGGRVAEEMVFGHDNVTSGATSDFQQATSLARAMVTRFGMSERVGTVFINDHREEGSEMRTAIDAEVKDLLDKSYKRAWDCLQTNRRDLEKLAKALLQHESLTGSEIKDVLAGKAIKTLSVGNRQNTAANARGGGGAAATATAKAAAAAAAKAAATAAQTASAATSRAARAAGGRRGEGGAEGDDAGAQGRLL